ncbi:hypothetical protein SNE40_017749 [Patella caerulea]|uniref:Beta-glucuronidase n=1 Tax=Patella caerulea TaxID=87958 RepID=A0AAN8PQD4_PATCE
MAFVDRITILVLLALCDQCFMNVEINVHKLKVAQHIGPKYVGVTIDSSAVRKQWGNIDFKSPKFLTLAKGLAPNFLRVGGTDCDFLIFNKTTTPMNGIIDKPKTHTNFTMTVAEWDQLNNFVSEVGWDLIFDLNVFLRKDGRWDPTNAIELLKYTIEKGYKPAAYELGNELDVFRDFNVTAREVAPDFAHLKQLLSSMPELAPYFILGTDAGTVENRSVTFMSEFFEAGGGASIDVATFHHYYMSSESATTEKFHSVTVLESLRPMLINVINLCKRFIPTKQVWLGETSSSYGGGAHEISDRYVASFLWLDKLGVSSVLGIQGVLRQTFYGGNYGLINSNLDPNPDYWLTILFKRLVASPVFTVPQPPNPDLRMYAHCTNTNSSMGYTTGSVTIYLLNLGNTTVPVDVPDMVNKTHHIYMFSPGDDSGLTSKSIKLNGVVLALTNDNELPPLKPVIGQGNIQVEAYNMGYIVFPGAMRPECV